MRLIESDHYSFEEIRPGVFVGLTRPRGAGVCNSGIVNLGEETLVFDTGLTPRAAHDLTRAATAATGRVPSKAANSHWHLDHMLGNQEFARLPIYATRRTVEILEARRAELLAELRPDRLSQDVRDFEGKARKAKSAKMRGYYELIAHMNRVVLEDSGSIAWTPPNHPFEGRLSLSNAPRTELVAVGSGHTESDAILVLPDDKVVFAGDLVVSHQHPNLTSGDPEHWLVVLREIRELEPEVVVSGHGALGTVETVLDVEDYLSFLLSVAAGETPDSLPVRFRDWHWPGQFDDNLAFLRARKESSGPTSPA